MLAMCTVWSTCQCQAHISVLPGHSATHRMTLLAQCITQCSAAWETVKDKICGSCNELVEDVANDEEASAQCECKECDCHQWYHWKCSNYDPNYFEEYEEESDSFCPKCVRCDIVMQMSKCKF